MVTDLRQKKIHLPVIPSAKTVRQRLAEVRTDAKKLEVLLRIATELEAVESDTDTPEPSEVARG